MIVTHNIMDIVVGAGGMIDSASFLEQTITISSMAARPVPTQATATRQGEL